MSVVGIFGLIASVACLATPIQTVDGQQVARSGAITGYITPAYDIGNGRFALHVGGWRVRNKLTQKIPWYIRPHADSDGLLLLTATRLSPRPKKTFRQKFTSTGTYPLGIVYPSIISPPSVGCWRLSMRSGAVRGSFVVLVRH